jgi:hypothetical protein
VRNLTQGEIDQISGGIAPVVAAIGVGAVSTGAAAYASGASLGTAIGVGLVGGVAVGFGAVAAATTGAVSAMYWGYSAATTALTGLMTRPQAQAQ